MTLLDLQQLYINCQNISSEARRHASKCITAYNKQAKLNGTELFDPFFYFKEYLPGYYNFLMDKVYLNNIDYKKNFKYTVQIDTDIYNTIGREYTLSNYLSKNLPTNITMNNIPLEFKNINSSFHSYVTSVLKRNPNNDISNVSDTVYYGINYSYFYLKEI